MKFSALGVVVTLLSVSACTTVDLSQVSVEKQVVSSVTVGQNVVERACKAMAAVFDSKGWNKKAPNEKVQSAASVLLNGMQKTDAPKVNLFKKIVSARQLSQDMELAQVQVAQTTKAAEVFLATSSEAATIEHELSLLEAALLSAYQAQSRFEAALIQAHKPLTAREFVALDYEIKQLKNITNSYGARMRSRIASQASTDHS